MESPTLTAAAHRGGVERVIARMRAPNDHTLSLAEIADLACLSPFHFSRVFRRQTGVPPGVFQAAVRLERAKRLLLETDLPVTEVCFEVGYSSLGAFTTRFTRLVGVSPGRLRRLPERVADSLGDLDLDPGRWRTAAGGAAEAGVGGRVEAALPVWGPIFLGLFPAAIPQGWPVASTVLPGPGRYRIAPVPDGRYHLLVAAVPPADGPWSWLLPAAETLFGCGRGPIAVERGRAAAPVDVALRPLRPIDPPIVVALPALLLGRAMPRTGRGRRDGKMREAWAGLGR